MDDLVEYLYKIKMKPVMYFGGRRTLSDLANFIYGFIAGREGTSKEIEESKSWFNPINEGSFQKFVMKKYDINISQSWYNIIEFHSSSENEAFDNFFKLLDEYLEK